MAKKKVNVKFLIALTAVVGGLALALFAGGIWYLARTSSAGLQHRAKVAEQQGKLPEAANFLANAAGKDPNNRELFMRAAEMYERCVSIDPVFLGKADAQYRRVLEIDPTYQPAIQKLMDEMVARLHDGATGTDFYTALKKLSDQAVSSDGNNPRYQIYTRVGSLLQWMYAAASSRPDVTTEKQIQELATLAEANPDIIDGTYYLSQAQLAIARNLRAEGDTDGAHKLLDTIQTRCKAAVAARPKNPEVQCRAAQVFGMVHDNDDRADRQSDDARLMQTAIEASLASVKPGDDVYGDVMALDAMWLKSHKATQDQIEKVYRDWAAAQPHDPRARYELANYLGSIPGKRIQAMDLLSKKLEPDPNARGYALVRVRDFERGTMVLLNTLRAQEAAGLQGKQRDDLIALINDDLAKLASNGSTEAPYYLKLRGKSEMLQGKLVDAIKSFERANVAMAQNGGAVDLDLWTDLQRLYLITGQTGTAQKMMEDLLHRFPAFAELRVKLAGLYLATNQLDKAREQIAILQANPPKDEAVAKQFEQIKLAAAIQGRDIKVVDSLPETTDEQKFLKARALAEANRPADAAHLLQEIARNTPGDEKTVYSLVDLYMQQKNAAQALQVVRAALKAKPDSIPFKSLQDLLDKPDSEAYQKFQEAQIDQIPDPMTKALRRAVLAMQTGDYAGAEKYLDQADKIRPDDRRTLLNRIQLLGLEHKYEAIDPVIEKIAKTNADGTGGLVVRTQVALERKDIPAALKYGSELVSTYGEFAGNWVLMGNAQLAAAQYRDAAASFDNALARQPNNLEAMKGKIAVLEALGQYPEEKVAIDHAQAIAPRDVRIRELALNYELRHGDADLVVAQCEQILKDEPENVAMYAALGQAELAAAVSKYAGDSAEAHKRLTHALEVLRKGMEKFGNTPEVLRFYVPMANVLDALGDSNGAAQALQQFAVHPLMKDKPEPYSEMAKLFERHGQMAKAQDAWRQAYVVSNHTVDTQLDLVQFLLRNSRAQDALKVLGEANGANPRVKNQRIEALLADKQLDEADKLIKEIYGPNPGAAEGLFYRGLIRLTRGQPAGAIDDLSAARNKDPQNPSIQIWLARAFVKGGRIDDATLLLEEMLRRNAHRDDARMLLLDTYAKASPPRWNDFDRVVNDALANPALAVNPAWHQELARSLADRNQFDVARKEIEAAMKLAPGNMALRDELVNVLIKASDWQGALAATDQQIAEGYKQPIVYGKRAIAHAKLGDKATAISEFDTAISGYMATKNSEGVADVVRTMAQILSPAEALSRVSQISDGSTRALLEVDLYGLQQDWPKQAQAAEVALNSAQLTSDQKVKLLRDSADAYLVMKQWDKARHSLEALVQIHPNDVLALNNLTYLIATVFKSPIDAKPFSQHAYDLAQSTGDKSIMDTHGWVLAQCGGNDLPQAINILQHVVDSNQTFTVARYHLAVAYLRQGGWQRASEELKTVQQQMKQLEQNHQPVPDELKTGVPKALEEVRQKSGQAGTEMLSK